MVEAKKRMLEGERLKENLDQMYEEVLWFMSAYPLSWCGPGTRKSIHAEFVLYNRSLY